MALLVHPDQQQRLATRAKEKKNPYGELSWVLEGLEKEIGLTSFRATMFDKSKNDEELKVNLDLLNELRERTHTRMARYHNRVSRYYNSKVKARRFEEGDLVLRKASQATKDNTRKIRPKLGWTLQSQKLHARRKLTSNKHGWDRSASSMEC